MTRFTLSFLVPEAVSPETTASVPDLIETAKAVRLVSLRIEQGYPVGMVRDAAGRDVGSFGFIEED